MFLLFEVITYIQMLQTTDGIGYCQSQPCRSFFFASLIETFKNMFLHLVDVPHPEFRKVMLFLVIIIWICPPSILCTNAFFRRLVSKSNSQRFVHCHLENDLVQCYRYFYVAVIIDLFIVFQILFEKCVEFQIFGISKLTIINLSKQ